MNDIVLEAVGITKRFGSQTVVDDVSLKVRRGEVVCILGPSGAGKSTFLRCLNLLETPEQGVVLLEDELVGYRNDKGVLRPLGRHRSSRQLQQMGMVFQSFNLFPHMTALQNVTLGLTRVSKVGKAEAGKRGMELLVRVGIAEKANARPAELSGGQQQRVAIARALAHRPKLILFDEPTSALDPEMVGEVLDVMRGLAEDGTTMIIVTHEVGFAREVADRFVFMEQGRVIDEGSSELLRSDNLSARARQFLAKVL